MTKRQKTEYTDRMLLQRNGWSANKKDFVAFNGGTESESPQHWHGKCMAAYALRRVGYRIMSEVSKDGVGEIDLVAYGHDSRAMIGIEIETDLKEDVIEDKRERYVEGEPITDIHSYDPADIPNEVHGAIDHIWKDFVYEP